MDADKPSRPFIKFSTGSIKASKDISSVSELRREIRLEIDEDLCSELVDLAYSEDGTFDTEVFIDSDTFFDSIIADLEPKDIALKFFNGDDLDSKGPANPNREYFRYNKKENIESTDDPGAIYYDTIFDEVVDYIMDHLEDTVFPEAIQELIDNYLIDNEEE